MQVEPPFEGILGSTVELRLLDYLLSLPKMDFNVTELARQALVSRESTHRVMKKLLQWQLLRPTDRRGNMTFYSIDLESPIVQSLYGFNEAIISHKFPDVARDLGYAANRASTESQLEAELSTASLYTVIPALDLDAVTSPADQPSERHRLPLAV